MRLSNVLTAALLALMAGLPGAPMALAPVAAARPAVHQASGLVVVPLKIRHGRKTFRFSVEVASTPQEQSRGLMFRKAMAPGEGMIFPMEPPRFASFWMRNTVLPLDIVFIGIDGRIMSIAPNARPFSEEQIMSGGLTKAVLELNAGRARALGIAPGDKVEW